MSGLQAAQDAEHQGAWQQQPAGYHDLLEPSRSESPLRQFSEIFCDRLKLFDRPRCSRAKGTACSRKFSTGSWISVFLAYAIAFYRTQLLGNVEARPLCSDHDDDVAEAIFRAAGRLMISGWLWRIGCPFMNEYPIP